MNDQRIANATRPAFKTPDGVEHPTWNAARKHLTGLDLLNTLREAGPDLAESRLVALRDHILVGWNVSRKQSRQGDAPNGRSVEQNNHSDV